MSSSTNTKKSEKVVVVVPSTVPSSDESEQYQGSSTTGSNGSAAVVKKKVKKSRQSKPDIGNGKRSPKVTKEKLCALIHFISTHENDGKGALKDVVAKRAGYLSATAPAFSMAVTRQKRNGLIAECDPTDNKLIDVTEEGRIIAERSGFKTEDLLAPPVGISWDKPPTMGTVATSKTSTGTVTTKDHHNRIRVSLRKKCHPKALQLFELLTNGYARSRPEVAAFLDFDTPNAAGLSFLLVDMKERGLLEFKRDRSSFGVMDWVMLTDACFLERP
jgi:hypothetical protein